MQSQSAAKTRCFSFKLTTWEVFSMWQPSSKLWQAKGILTFPHFRNKAAERKLNLTCSRSPNLSLCHSLSVSHTHTKRNTRYTEIICHLILPLVGSPSVSFCPFLPTLFLPFLSFLFPFSVMLSDVSKSLGKKTGSPFWERVASGHHQTLSLLERLSSYINWLQ